MLSRFPRQLFEAGPYRLTVIETPGHAVGHISLYEPGLKALFAGDLLSGFGTISIVPPAGSMRDYMASLHRVNEFEIDIIYPGHGPAIINGNERIDQYIERRESREREIFDAVASGLDTSEAVTALIYPEVQPRHPGAAEGTVRAHLIHLAEQGRIRVLDAGGGHPRYVACQKP
ncbi:MAG: MBL fold metallo-hydrolase [Thermomicrobiales bacterium]